MLAILCSGQVWDRNKNNCLKFTFAKQKIWKGNIFTQEIAEDIWHQYTFPTEITESIYTEGISSSMETKSKQHMD